VSFLVSHRPFDFGYEYLHPPTLYFSADNVVKILDPFFALERYAGSLCAVIKQNQ